VRSGQLGRCHQGRPWASSGWRQVARSGVGSVLVHQAVLATGGAPARRGHQHPETPPAQRAEAGWLEGAPAPASR